MFSRNGLMTHLFLLSTGDVCIFDIECSVGRTFIFFGIYNEKSCLISLTAELLRCSRLSRE